MKKKRKTKDMVVTIFLKSTTKANQGTKKSCQTIIDLFLANQLPEGGSLKQDIVITENNFICYKKKSSKSI